MGIQFDQPWALLLLPLCLAFVYVTWLKSRAYLPPARRAAALALRLIVVGLVVVALAGPLVQLSATQLALAVLVDRSDSIPPAAQANEDQWVTDALAHKAADDELAVVSFAGDARVERPLSADTTQTVIADPADLHTGRTDIAAAIRTGLAALPSGMARRLVVLSDGQQNQEQSDAAAALAAAAGVQVDVVPLQQDSGPEALVDGLDAPSQLRQGDSFSVDARIRATQASQATLHLLVDGQLAVTQDVDLQVGANRFVVPMEPLAAGQHVFELQLEADADTLAQNNTGGAYVVVSGPPSVLVVEGAPGDGQFLTDALRAQGLQVDVTDPASAQLDSDVLRGYAAVVLANVAASRLAPQQLSAIQSYVHDFGGGLVVTGGDQAFGPGGYARTPLEDMLPVQMGLRGQSDSASTALVLVIDTSGSMGDDVSGSNKMDLAKQAAVAAAQSLGQYDQIGVVAFEDQPRWVIQPTSAADLGAVQSAIDTMQPGGGTEIYPALDLAYQGLQPVQAKVKHIVLLTDGESPAGPYDQLTEQMRAAGITLSTIGIGSDADTALLQQLAQQGSGGYYDGNDPFNLPQLVVKDTQQVQRAAIVEQDTQPRAVGDSPALASIDTSALPSLRGYVATTPKPQANVSLVSPQLDPILSDWQYGLGRVIAWTSDTSNRWSSRWLDWPDFGRFWGQVMGRAARAPEDPGRQVSVSVDGSQARITLDAQTGPDDPQQHYLNFVPTVATLVDPRGARQQLTLPQVAPGRYETTVPVDDDGVYQLDVQQTDSSDGSVAQKSSGFVVPYSPEYRADGTNTEVLQALSDRTGGHMIQDVREALAHDLPAAGAPRPIWPDLMMLAAVLLVFDVAVRRIRFGAAELQALRHRAPIPRLPRTETPVARRPSVIPTLARSVPEARRATAEQVYASTDRRASRLLAARQRANRR